jgi:5-methylcytosine-specific restriction endonuclease McrA
MIRKVTAAKKKQIAGRQHFTCSANIKDYKCPLNGKPFDESGYEIDHILELKNGGSNDDINLQALCVSCHRVKTSRLQMAPKANAAQSKAVKPKVAKPTEAGLNYYDAPLFTDRSKVNLLSMYNGLMDSDSD